jgi:flavin-dependent thymidylate synthase
MKVILAGYNLDTNTIEDLKNGVDCKDKITPETISASYARISRDPRPVNELRDDARAQVSKSRKSNEVIIFGMGHSSVAEHAVFNFDILKLSRFAIEELEHFRLASFTEKSQRYITLDGDYVIPQDVKNTKYESMFNETIEIQNKLYKELFEKIKTYIFDKEKELAKDPKNERLLEGWAKEDARYITCLGTEGQLGMTVNARTLELMLRRFSSSKVMEVRELGDKIYEQVKDIAPSLVKYTKATDFDLNVYNDLKKMFDSQNNFKNNSKEDVKLIKFDENSDNIIIASLMHTVSRKTFEECLKEVRDMNSNEKEKIIRKTFEYMKFFNPVLREFEFSSFMFELIISASCFAQLKRHRMLSITTQDYDINLGVIIPESVKNIGLEKKFLDVISNTEKVYKELQNNFPISSQYLLTNSHKRRVIVKLNAREMYHMSRLREDFHAQWDIKNITGKMSDLVKEKSPLTSLLLCGKSEYEKNYNKVFN